MNTKKFQPTFQLIANSISEVNITNTIESFSNDENLKREFSFKPKNIAIEEHENYKSAGVDLEVNVLVERDDASKFDATFVFNGVFIDNVKVPNEELEEKLRINGVAALYSIARGCITNISSQVLVDGKIVLPLVNFVEAAETIGEEI